MLLINFDRLIKIFILLSLFGFVFAVAVLNPVVSDSMLALCSLLLSPLPYDRITGVQIFFQGTALVSGNVASLTSIAELGVFLIIMLRRAHSLDFR